MASSDWRRFLVLVLSCLGYLLVCVLVFAIHARWLRVDVVFYSAMLDAVVAAVLCSLWLRPGTWLGQHSALERIQTLLIWLLLGYAFAISVPTVIDRSLSLYLLEKIAQRGGEVPREGFTDIVRDEYLREHRLVDIRLTEQAVSGTIVLEPGCVRLTARGRQLARFSRWFRIHWLPRNRRLLNGYGDELVDPFSGRESVPASPCRGGDVRP